MHTKNLMKNLLEVDDTVVADVYVICAVDVVKVADDRMRWTADCPSSCIKHSAACCSNDTQTLKQIKFIVQSRTCLKTVVFMICIKTWANFPFSANSQKT